MSKVKLIIFDCDGVLVDSEMIVTNHLVRCLSDHGYHICSEDWIKRFTGKTDQLIYHEINAEMQKPVITNTVIKKMQQQIHSLLYKEVRATPGIEEVFTHVQKIGISMCVASSGTIEKINNSLTVTGLNTYFQPKHLFSAQSVKQGKPAPDLFLFAAKQMGFQPQDCLVIEDSVAGIKAASSAGMKVLGFIGGSHAKYAWYEHNIRAFNIPIANNATELLDFLIKL
ncbi:MAG: HAD family phosphatase [Legionella sp.]|nr:HAD family phosphatase [Legionella sp.]